MQFIINQNSDQYARADTELTVKLTTQYRQKGCVLHTDASSTTPCNAWRHVLLKYSVQGIPHRWYVADIPEYDVKLLVVY